VLKTTCDVALEDLHIPESGEPENSARLKPCVYKDVEDSNVDEFEGQAPKTAPTIGMR
jgi:hypothetical protein